MLDPRRDAGGSSVRPRFTIRNEIDQAMVIQENVARSLTTCGRDHRVVHQATTQDDSRLRGGSRARERAGRVLAAMATGFRPSSRETLTDFGNSDQPRSTESARVGVPGFSGGSGRPYPRHCDEALIWSARACSRSGDRSLLRARITWPTVTPQRPWSKLHEAEREQALALQITNPSESPPEHSGLSARVPGDRSIRWS